MSQRTEVIHSGKYYQVFKSGSDQIIKTHASENATADQADNLRKEYQMGNYASNNATRVVKFKELREKLVDNNVQVSILMQDIGAKDLYKQIPTNGYPLAKFLHIATECVQGLQEIHNNGVIHKDVKPSNMLFTKDEKIIYIDFGSAATFREQALVPVSKNQRVHGTAKYISPEQTGRTNKQIDHRTDFYSLGVTFYQLISGKLPFETSDLSQLLISHVTRQAPALPNTVPLVVSDIIEKLMRKDPNDRYQSCFGLSRDLEKCKSYLAANQTIDRFTLGQEDFVDTFLSTKLYGREQELKALKTIIHDVSETSITQLVTVSGRSGVGKSCLVRDLQYAVQRMNGHLCSGKYDQLDSNSLYSGIVDAMRDLVKQILVEDDDELVKWKTMIEQAAGHNGKLLTDLVPEIEKIIGPQPDVAKISLSERKSRLENTIAKFVQVFAQNDKPLVFFVDDVQWCDEDSFQLLASLTKQVTKMVMVFAYRDHEVQVDHQLVKTVSDIKEAIKVKEINLTPVTEKVVESWVCDMIGEGRTDRVSELSRVVFEKTHGEPLFVNQFLQTLRVDKLLVRNDVWKWNIADIKSQSVTDNVAKLMEHRVSQLSSDAIEVMKILSCMGSSCCLDDLSCILASRSEDVLSQLHQAIKIGVILLIDNRLHFSHDRVREACHSLVSQDKLAGTHFNIGMKLRQKEGTICQQTDIIDHLNKGREFVANSDESVTINQSLLESMANMNVVAFQKSLSSASYKAAIKYIKEGLSCLEIICRDENQRWTKYHDLLFTLYIELANVYIQVGRHDESASITEFLLNRANSRTEKCNVYKIRSIVSSMLLDGTGTFNNCNNILSLFNIDIGNQNQSESEVIINNMLEKVVERNGNINIDGMYQTTASDEEQIKCYALLNICLYAYMHNQSLFDLSVTNAFSIMLSSDVLTPEVSGVAVFYCTVAMGKGDWNKVKLVNSLISECTKKQFRDHVAENVRALHLHTSLVNHFYIKRHKIGRNYRRVANMGVESGEACYGCFAMLGSITDVFYVGGELNAHVQHVKDAYSFITKFKTPSIRSFVDIVEIAIITLQGKTSLHNAVQEIKSLDQKNNPCLTSAFNCVIEWIDFTLNLVDISCPPVQRLQSILDYENEFNSTLQNHIMLKLFTHRDVANEEAELKIQLATAITRFEERISQWAKLNADYKNWNCLIKAEEAAYIDNNQTQAFVMYNKAIKYANEGDFVHEVALAHELFAKYQYSCNNPDDADRSMAQSYLAYKKWGAYGKTAMLASKHEHIRKLEEDLQKKELETLGTDTINQKVKDIKIDESIAKALFGKADADCTAVLSVVLQNGLNMTNALKMTLIVNDVVILQTKRGSSKINSTRVRLQDWNGCLSVVNCARTFKQCIVTGNAFEEEREKLIRNDPYVRKNKLRSIMCMPLFCKDEIIGFICAENRNVYNCFEEIQVDNFSVIGSLASLSLENDIIRKDITEVKRRNSHSHRYINHESRNPAQGIMSNSELIIDIVQDFQEKMIDFNEKKYGEKLNTVLELAQDIMHCGRHIKNVSDSSMILSKLENNELKINNTPTNIGDICKNIISKNKLSAENKEIDLRLKIADDVNNKMLLTDEEHISFILNNFISNSIKFTEVGMITLKCDAKNITEDKVVVQFCVADTGIGIKEQELQHLFNLYSRSSQRVGGEYNGTGLGLYISKGISNLMGGDVWVYSGYGHGCEFYFKFTCNLAESRIIEKIAIPTVDQDYKSFQFPNKVKKVDHLHLDCSTIAAKLDQLSPISGQSLTPDAPPALFKVLVVEDNHINQKVIVRMVTKATTDLIKKQIINVDFTIDTANDGAQGLALFKTHEHNLIIMDVSMPIMDGIECTKKIREHEEIKNKDRTHIVGLSGNTNLDSVAIQAGMNNYVYKPCRRERFEEIIKDIFT
ncbi:hybrid signal transduction histidine kinase dhkG [Acrasis kona]|uniref:Hybrid signal transduction histidine kinase dhkG n=1 Tax=Acrasis kona TaxID=1008807 RepID=A0AAW2Z104_9EUKA